MPRSITTRASGGGAQALEHPGQRAGLAGVAGEDPRAAHEAAGVEHEGEGEQGAVGALLLAAAALGGGLVGGGAFEVGVGEVVEGDGGLEVEQGEGFVEEELLDGGAVAHEGVGGAVELHGGEGLEGPAEEFAEGAVGAQPEEGGAFGAAAGEAADEGAEGAGLQLAGEAEGGEQGGQAELVEGPQGGVLEADGAGAEGLEGAGVDGDEVGGFGVGVALEAVEVDELAGEGVYSDEKNQRSDPKVSPF